MTGSGDVASGPAQSCGDVEVAGVQSVLDLPGPRESAAICWGRVGGGAAG